MTGILYSVYLHPDPVEGSTQAKVAQLVEHHLAKVRVASSSLVFRSPPHQRGFQFKRGICFKDDCSLGKKPAERIAKAAPAKPEVHRPDGGIGRHAGLKILLP